MIRNNKKLLLFFTVVCLPAFVIGSPEWLKINGITPCWPVIWLLPFSLKSRPWIAFLAAICLGIFMDSFTIDKVSYIPSLVFLSLVWGRNRIQNNKIELLFNIGLMSIFGTICVGFSIWIQKILFYNSLRNHWFNSWAIYVLISEIIITGLVAPFFSSWLLLSYKKN